MADPAPAPPRDPRSDVMPDYSVGSAAAYVVDLAARLSVTEDQARGFAVANWNFEHQSAVEAWEEHQASFQEARRLEEEERQRQEEEARHLREEEERLRQAEEDQRRQEAEDARREREPNQEQTASTFTFPKIGQELVSTRADYGITEYALTALRDPTKLVDFWYFTHEGCEEARKLALASVADDVSAGLHGKLDPTTNTFSFMRVSAAGKPSRNAAPDASLTLRQLSEAKQVFGKYAKQSGWDEAHIQAFVVLIMRLESHDAPRRYPEFGERALVRPQLSQTSPSSMKAVSMTSPRT
ncbi:hypothetical protein GSI_10685 [Ganoderma sinense ZZ0214-1]|uniref:Uncharacterized protein n=1 Tax=Ganoderma sinense ZZ0214-1 TaxID=1077348 RepID=A0A2G8S1B7_9APHY|nr:hypothetical protein GSI_10685 [Ganoderma sinense ZZ0214-1]